MNDCPDVVALEANPLAAPPLTDGDLRMQAQRQFASRQVPWQHGNGQPLRIYGPRPGDKPIPSKLTPEQVRAKQQLQAKLHRPHPNPSNPRPTAAGAPQDTSPQSILTDAAEAGSSTQADHEPETP